jgi:hypothetical protein
MKYTSGNKDQIIYRDNNNLFDIEKSENKLFTTPNEKENM